MKKILVYLLIVCMCLSVLAGCTTLKGNDKGAIVNMYLTSFPQSLDPAAVQYDADTAFILNLIYQPLTAIDAKGKTIGALAKSWYGRYDAVNEEYEMYFELYNTAWSDTIAVSVNHVIYAWKRILSPEYESPYASLLYPIKNAKAVKSGLMTSDDLGIYPESDTLLRVVFEEDYDINLFAEIVSNIAFAPLREDIITKAIKDNINNERALDWDKNSTLMVASGPFRVQSYTEGVRITLERNTFYYRDPEEHPLDRSVLPYRINCTYQPYFLGSSVSNPISEQQFQYNRFNEGKIVYVGNLTKDIYQANAGSVTTTKQLSTYNYYFNTQNPLLSDARVRQALSIALDRQAIVDLLGTGEIAMEGYVPSGVFNNGSGSDFRSVGGAVFSKTGDINAAKSLLSAAGVNGGEITLSYLSSTTKAQENRNNGKVVDVNNALIVAQYAKGVWEQLGFTVTLEALYPESFAARLSAAEFDVIGLDAAINSTDALGYLAMFSKYYSGNIVPYDYEHADEDNIPYTPHYTGIEDDDYDALIDSITYEKDRVKRAELLHEAEEMLAELCPATALYQHVNSYLISGRISKISTDYYGMFNMNKLKLKDYLNTNPQIEEEEKSLQDANG